MSDSIFATDREYRAQMEKGCNMLLKAIQALRSGTCPATPATPYKLPADWTNRVNPYPELPTKERAKTRPCNTRVIEMMLEGKTANEIAAALKISRQKATAIMGAIKLQQRARERLVV